MSLRAVFQGKCHQVLPMELALAALFEKRIVGAV